MTIHPSATPGLVIAAPRSGSGKTVLTLGVLRALARRALHVQPAKCGPDYIDPGFHRAATGRASFNLDSWAMRPSLIDMLIQRAMADADIIICEALMGLFDGRSMSGQAGDGSSASIAARTGWPVILVLDVSGQSESAAAVASGFARFDSTVKIAGIVLNRVGSERHRRLCTEAIELAGVPVIGSLPRNTKLAFPERHLGLVQAEETSNLDRTLDGLAAFVCEHVDLDKLVSFATVRPNAGSTMAGIALQPPGQRIAVARDAAFSFVYPHVLEGWRSAGAEIFFFSPLKDEAPPPQTDVCWLPGGYPELYASMLAANTRFLTGLRRYSQENPIHGECGGYMVLGETLQDQQGDRHKMAGLLGLHTSLAERHMHLGYRKATLLCNTVFGSHGARFRGHEFHYATISDAGYDEALFAVTDAMDTFLGQMGSRRGRVSGSFFHLIDIAE